MKRNLTVETDVLFHADLATVLQVLLDTENYPKFIANITSSSVISKEKDNSEVLFTAKVAFFSFEYSIKTTKVSEHHITFEQKNGFFQLLNGEWRLKENHDVVEGTYIVHVKLPLFAAGAIVKKALDIYFPAMLKDFKSEIERTHKEG